MACAFSLPFFPRLDFGPAVESPFRFLPAGSGLATGAPCDEVGLELSAAACRVADLVPAIAIVYYNRRQLMMKGGSRGSNSGVFLVSQGRKIRDVERVVVNGDGAGQ